MTIETLKSLLADIDSAEPDRAFGSVCLRVEEWRAIRDSVARLEALCEHLLFDMGGSPDHMTACEKTMGATHPCTCGADRLREMLNRVRI